MACGCKRKNNGYMDSSFIYYNEQYNSDTELWALCGQEYKSMEFYAKKHENDGNIKFALYKPIAPNYTEAKAIAAEYDGVPGTPCLVRYLSETEDEHGHHSLEMVLAVKISNDVDPLFISSEFEQMVKHDPIVFVDKSGDFVHEYNIAEALIYILENTYSKETIDASISSIINDYLENDKDKYDDIITLILGEQSKAFPYTDLADIYQIKREIGDLFGDVDGKFRGYIEKIKEIINSLAELKVEYAILEKKYEDASTTIAEKDAEIASLEKTIESLNTQISELKDIISGKEEEIKQKDASISELKEVIVEKDASINELNEVIAEKDENISELEDVIEKRDASISELEEVIVQKDASISELKETIVEKDASISELKEVISEKDSTIAQKDASISELKEVISEKDSSISELKEVIVEKDATIAQRDSSISELTETIIEKDSEIAQKDASISELNSVITQKESEIAQKDASISELKETIVEKDASIELLKTSYDVAVSYDDTMGAVYGSGSYTYNNTVKLTAVPNTGYDFDSWEDNSEASSTREVLVDSNKYYTAKFKESTYYTYAVSSATGDFSTIDKSMLHKSVYDESTDKYVISAEFDDEYVCIFKTLYDESELPVDYLSGVKCVDASVLGDDISHDTLNKLGYYQLYKCNVNTPYIIKFDNKQNEFDVVSYEQKYVLLTRNDCSINDDGITIVPDGVYVMTSALYPTIAFNGSKDKSELDSNNNIFSLLSHDSSYLNNGIDELNNISFTINLNDNGTYLVKSTSGEYYISGIKNGSNGILTGTDESDFDSITTTMDINSDNECDFMSISTYFRLYKTSTKTQFRFYKSSSIGSNYSKVYLYKREWVEK